MHKGTSDLLHVGNQAIARNGDWEMEIEPQPCKAAVLSVFLDDLDMIGHLFRVDIDSHRVPWTTRSAFGSSVEMRLSMSGSGPRCTIDMPSTMLVQLMFRTFARRSHTFVSCQ